MRPQLRQHQRRRCVSFLVVIATLTLTLFTTQCHGVNLRGADCYGGCFFTTCSGQTSFYVNDKADVAFSGSSICVRQDKRILKSLNLKANEIVVAAHSGISYRVRRTGHLKYDFNKMSPPTLFKSYAVFREKCVNGRQVFGRDGRPQYVPTGRSGIGRQSFSAQQKKKKFMELADKCYVLAIDRFFVRNTKTGIVRHIESKNTRSCIAFYAIYNDDKDDKDDVDVNVCSGVKKD